MKLYVPPGVKSTEVLTAPATLYPSSNNCPDRPARFPLCVISEVSGIDASAMPSSAKPTAVKFITPTRLLFTKASIVSVLLVSSTDTT